MFEKTPFQAGERFVNNRFRIFIHLSGNKAGVISVGLVLLRLSKGLRGEPGFHYPGFAHPTYLPPFGARRALTLFHLLHYSYSGFKCSVFMSGVLR